MRLKPRSDRFRIDVFRDVTIAFLARAEIVYGCLQKEVFRIDNLGLLGITGRAYTGA
jgi:hypothetical protein